MEIILYLISFYGMQMYLFVAVWQVSMQRCISVFQAWSWTCFVHLSHGLDAAWSVPLAGSSDTPRSTLQDLCWACFQRNWDIVLIQIDFWTVTCDQMLCSLIEPLTNWDKFRSAWYMFRGGARFVDQSRYRFSLDNDIWETFQSMQEQMKYASIDNECNIIFEGHGGENHHRNWFLPRTLKISISIIRVSSH